MITPLCALATAVMLFYILRYRVHFHVTYQEPSTAATGRRPKSPAKAIPAAVPPRRLLVSNRTPAGEDTRRLTTAISALVNLGCTRAKASAAARRAVDSRPESEPELIRRAIQEASTI